ncbi:MAG TPA: hypothetical protein ENK96_03050 [Desulfobulbaceae bacterium]|nr:hypothetical protein [Desulfobulbaceae bacterium]
MSRKKLYEFFHEIKDSGERLTLLLNDLLDLAKLEAGSMRYSVEEHNITITVQSAVTEFKAAAEERGVILILDVPKKPLIGWFDDARMARSYVTCCPTPLNLPNPGKQFQ